MGSRDPEAAAQEAIRRSLAHASSRSAVEYYFGDPLTANAEPPAWTLAQLLGWLHGVLRFVVWEDGARASSRRETLASIDDLIEFPDRAPSQLDVVIDAELRAIVHECLTRLSDERRTALLLRLQGVKYQEIARRLDMNEKTVATWLHRGTLELIQRIDRFLDGGDVPCRHRPGGSVRPHVRLG
jgi:RNA polymerase sigma factor (sigma-70 family)